MDAAVLVMSTVEDKSEGPAKLMFRVGNHLVEDLSWYFRRWAQPADTPVIERFEFEQAWTRLQKAGYQCKPAEEAWNTFARLRSSYAAPINALARALAIIPAEWIGDRSYLPHRERESRRSRLRRRRRS